MGRLLVDVALRNADQEYAESCLFLKAFGLYHNFCFLAVNKHDPLTASRVSEVSKGPMVLGIVGLMTCELTSHTYGNVAGV